MRWLDGVIDSMDMSLRKFQVIEKDREAWRAAVHRITKSRTRLRDSTIKLKSRPGGSLYSLEEGGGASIALKGHTAVTVHLPDSRDAQTG